MKKNKKDSLKALLLTVVILVFTKMCAALPWWTFIVPVVITGLVITIRKWQFPAFIIGYVAGFMVWFGSNLYFSLKMNDIILSKIGEAFSVPGIVVLLGSGMIGGLLTGLALYSGQSVVSNKIKQFPI